MKRQIIRNEKRESDKSIADKMDFAAVLGAAQDGPSPEKPSKLKIVKSKWFMTLATVIAIGVVGLVSKIKSKKEAKEQAIVQVSIDQPVSIEDSVLANEPIFIENPLDVAFASFEVDAASGGSYTHPSGTTIDIPPTCFVDKNGNTISNGTIQMEYRELHDQVDFFVSQIPMNYDSSGIEYTFESGGMIEIRATQNGEKVDLTPEKPISINLVSEQPGAHFNLYSLNNETWDYEGVPEYSYSEDTPCNLDSTHLEDIRHNMDTLEMMIAGGDAEIKEIEDEIQFLKNWLRNPPLTKPQVNFWLADEQQESFVVSGDIAKYPGLKGHKDRMFQLKPGQTLLTQDIYDTNWEEIEIKRMSDSVYTIYVAKALTSHLLEAKPVLTQQDFDRAQFEHDKRLSKYKQKIQDKENQLKEAQFGKSEISSEVLAARKRLEEKRRKYYEERNKLNEQIAQQNLIQAEYLRKFNITKMGTWNCDSPIKQPKGRKLTPSFTNGSGEPIDIRSYSLIEKKRNSIFKFASNQVLQYNPREDNLLLAFGFDGKTYIYNTKEFKKIPKTHHFTLTMNESGSKDAEELKREVEL